MALISRFSRLFRADLHAVMDRIEEPEVLLRQSVREMEENQHDDQRNLKILEHELGGLPALLSENAEQLSQVQEEINLCLESDNDKLARSKIRRKLELQQRSKRLQSKQELLQQEVTALRERVSHNRQRLESMRQKLEIFSQQVDQHVNNALINDVQITDDDIEVALLGEKKLHAKRPGGAK